MIEVVPFEASMFETLELGDIDRQNTQSLNMQELVYKAHRTTMAAVKDGRCLGFAGLAQVGGEIHGWLSPIFNVPEFI